MKSTLLKSVILLTAISFSLISCKDDEETQKNSFKYNQKEAEIGTAMGFAYGQTDVSGVYWIATEFFENSFGIHYVNGYPDSLSGSGDALFITFLTNNATVISPGEYTYKPSDDPARSFGIDPDEETGMVIGFNTNGSDDPVFTEISGGKVTVAKNGDEYEFTFNLNTKINTTITGYYKGKPTIFTEKKKKSTANQMWFPR